ncbi:MAG TPA: type II toxin-antitoxin system VapC family toxin [Chthoniobacterales bacterium]|nr:type II toxin-antitoxin system VapC family toxin [Chthoniobacterales bacterium]
MAFLIDTHIWIWWMDRSPRLPPSLLATLDEAAERPLLSVASLWELSLLVECGELTLLPDAKKWLESACHPHTVQLAQLTPGVALELLELPRKFQRDPADRMIVATARALEVPVLTYDRQIRKSGLVKLWK